MSTPFDRRLLWMHWQGEAVRESSLEALADNIQRATPNVAGVAVKTSTGAQWQGTRDSRRALSVDGPGDIQRWVQVLNERGLETHVWCVVQGQDIDRESDLISAACNTPGVNSMLLNVESGAGYFADRTAADARSLITRVRARISPDFHLGLVFFAGGHHPTSIFIQEWLPYVQSLHPMVYHWEFGAGRDGPEPYLNETFGTLAQYGLPVVPMLQTYPVPTPVPGEQIFHAAEYAFAKGAVGVSFFRYGGECSTPVIMDGMRRIDPRRQVPVTDPARRLFRVRAAHLRVRETPGVSSLSTARIGGGALVEVDAASRIELDGYIWWRSDQGWLPQTRADYRHMLMIDVTPGVPPFDLPLLDALTLDLGESGPDVPHKRFRVVTRSINIRTQPDLGRDYLLDTTLQAGDEILVNADAWTEQGGFVWWFHGPGWSVERALGSSLRFMEDLTPEVPRLDPLPLDEFDSVPSPDEPEESIPEPDLPPEDSPLPIPDTEVEPGEWDVPLKRFRVITRTLNVRSEPGLARRAVNGVLREGDEIEPRADAWRELDGYLWWQHGNGWSAERRLDDRQRFMEDLTPLIGRIDYGDQTPAPAPGERPPEPEGPHHYRVVALGATIRDDPNTNAIRTGRLRQGEEVLIDREQRVEADGYLWVRHERGWSVEHSLDGSEEVMLDMDALPLLGTLFQRLPVRLEEIDWLQYYGNTRFAYRYGPRNSYDKFSQGLHSGLDFGKFQRNPENPPVFAAVEGMFAGRGQKYGPNRADVLVGPYRIIYGHIGHPARLRRRQPVSPDTVMGVVENSQLHLHVEVRYRDRYLVNPLLMMPPALVEHLIGKFPARGDDFVRTDTWDRWLTPLDQPVIRLGGEVIGPTA